MPQLDRIIIFPQIFWLFLIFTLFYIVLTHFFLPKFLTSLRARRDITNYNEFQTSRSLKRLIEIQLKLKNLLLKDLLEIRRVFTENSTFSSFNMIKLNTQQADELVSDTIKNSVLFCNFQILDSVDIHLKRVFVK